MPVKKKRFTREAKLYRLQFEDEELEGFECVMAGVSLGEFLDFTVVATTLDTDEGKTPENIEKQFAMIGSQLREWNLDDEDGNPVPADYEHLREQDFGFVQQIMAGYMQAMSGVPKASNRTSSSGGLSAEELTLGLGDLSQSLAS